MVQTRSGEVSTASDSKAAHQPAAEKDSKNQAKTKAVNEPAKNEQIEARDEPAKRKREEEDEAQEDGVDRQSSPSSDNEQPPLKAAREEEQTEPSNETEPSKQTDSSKETTLHKIKKTIDEYGSLPLTGMAVKEPLKPTPETLLAMVIHAMLRSTRISHDLAEKAAVHVIKAGYHDIKVLSEASWDDKVKVLSEGGYNRYREAGATKLDDLADLVNTKYDGDLNNLLQKAEDKPERIRQLIREIKGFGDVATDLFCDDAQAVWPVLAPTIDHRSLDTADEVGLGRDIDGLYSLLGRDPVQMSKLARGLSYARLSRRQGDIEHEE